MVLDLITETGSGYGHGVGSRREQRGFEIAAGIGRKMLVRVGSVITDADGGLWNRRAGGVFYCARNGALRGGLRQQRDGRKAEGDGW
jgi:hypothetical protein